jgi:hypothetical protein
MYMMILRVLASCHVVCIRTTSAVVIPWLARVQRQPTHAWAVLCTACPMCGLDSCLGSANQRGAFGPAQHPKPNRRRPHRVPRVTASPAARSIARDNEGRRGRSLATADVGRRPRPVALPLGTLQMRGDGDRRRRPQRRGQATT